MALELNEQVLVLSLGSSGLCVVLCAAVCCCRDFFRRNRLRELAAEPAEDRDRGLEEPSLSRVLITGYQAPIRRLDPFSFRKTTPRGNNAQANYEKVTSSGEDNIDRLVRAYGSLAAEIAPEDRLKLLAPGKRRKEPAQSAIAKGARSLEVESGEAPSRQPEDTKMASRARRVEAPSAHSAGSQRASQASTAPRPAATVPPAIGGGKKEDEESRIPPQVLGKPQKASEAAVGSKPAPDVSELLRHIELPPPAPASPKHAPAALSDEPLEPPCPRDEKLDALDKFDALDAELNEQLSQSICPGLESKTLHKSLAGLPRSGSQGTRTGPKTSKAKGRSKRTASPATS